MKQLNCELFCHSNSAHLQQIYTGFRLLEKRGVLNILPKIYKKELNDESKPPHIRDARYYHLKVTLNEQLSLYYDVHDSYEVDSEILKNVDFYFKRSYSAEKIRAEDGKNKIFPLGLNYSVYDSRLDLFCLKRSILDNGMQALKNICKAMNISRFYLGDRFYYPHVENCFSYPDFRLPLKVLFMARAWLPGLARSKDRAEEREIINSMRAQCVRLLKKEFGNRFMGGFSHDEYSRKYFSDCLIPNKNLSQKRTYMKMLKQYPICVSTAGLHGSSGWKFAEYICHSKSIVAEKLNYHAPGGLENGKNYLEFLSPEECVEFCVRLFQDGVLRNKIMINNYRYYYSFLKPDSLILNSLSTALEHFKKGHR